MKSRLNILFLLSLLFFSCSRVEQPVTIMSFNIRYDNPEDGLNRWEARVPLVAAYMDSVAPDIAGMQEVRHNQLIDLQKIMPGYSFIGTGRDDGKQGGEYSPVFFRNDRFIMLDNSQFWLSETPEIPGSRSWDAAITRVVSWARLEDKLNGKILFVFNTHFDHRGVQARINSIRLLSDKIDEIAGGHPVLVTGDFNIRKGSDDYNLMVDTFSENNELTNAVYISLNPVTDADNTFNGFRSGLEPRVIDFIFVNNSFKVNYFRVDKVTSGEIFISDHWPVVAESEFLR